MQLKLHIVVLTLITWATTTSATAQKLASSILKGRATELAQLLIFEEVADRYLTPGALGDSIYKTVIDWKINGLKSAVYWRKGDANPICRLMIEPTDSNIHYTETRATEFLLFEKELIDMQITAMKIAAADTSYKPIPGTYRVVIPVISKLLGRRCYILTRSTAIGETLFGEDYIIEFDKNNQVVSARKIHNDLTKVAFLQHDNEVIPFHRHEINDINLETDLAAVLLARMRNDWPKFIFWTDNKLDLYDLETLSVENENASKYSHEIIE